MADSKNHFVKKQDETVVEVDIPGKDLKVLIPDNRYAYGDNESVAQMAQDVVGKHSDDEGARGAYEQAREQLETTDFKTLKRENAIRRVNAKKPKFTVVPDEDDFGVLKRHESFYYIESSQRSAGNEGSLLHCRSVSGRNGRMSWLQLQQELKL